MKMRTVVLPAVITAIIFTSCAKNTVQGFANGKNRDVVTMKGFNLVQTVNGEKKLDVKAEEANILPKEKKIKFFTVNAKYMDKGKEVSTLSSKSGFINTVTNDLEVFGNVVLKTKDNSRLNTEYLKWSEKNQKIYTDKAVKVTKGDNIMSGIGMESDLMLENVEIKKVSTTITDLDALKDNEKEKGKK